MTVPVPRRTLLRAMAAAGTVTAASLATGCATPATRRAATDSLSANPSTEKPEVTVGQNRVLLAYFSRPGENYYYGGRRNLTVGNTEVLARTIARRVDCDVHRIEAVDPYPEDYEATVARNVREQDTDARPAIANPLPALDGYDVVLLASPIWNVAPPRIMLTFAEALDFDGLRVHPVTTHAMGGLGTSERDYGEACRGASIGNGLAVQGERVTDAGPAVDAWLRRARLNQT